MSSVIIPLAGDTTIVTSDATVLALPVVLVAAHPRPRIAPPVRPVTAPAHRGVVRA